VFRIIADDAFETKTKKQNYENALADYQKALTLAPNAPKALSAVGEILFISDRRGEAIKYLEKAVSLDARNDRAWLFLGMSRGTKSATQAIEDITKAILLDGKKALYYTKRAVFFSALGQHNKAIEDLTHAINLEPKGWTHYHSRAMQYQKIGRQDLAEKDEELSEKYDR